MYYGSSQWQVAFGKGRFRGYENIVDPLINKK